MKKSFIYMSIPLIVEITLLLILTIIMYLAKININKNILSMTLAIPLYILYPFIISNKVHKKGFLIGIIVSLILTFILVISRILIGDTISTKIIIKYLICIIVGIFFSIIGVNFKKIFN